MASNPIDLLALEIHEESVSEANKNIWSNSKFHELPKLQCNNVGKIGERFIERLLVSAGIETSIDGSKTRKLGGGNGDGVILGKTVEIKTAQQGCHSNSFQHELGENPWNSNYMIFLDITPVFVYITIFKNFTEDIYKSGMKMEPFPTRKVTWRKGTGAFKLDTTPTICEYNARRGLTIKITENTTDDDIKSYVSRIMTA